MKTLKYYKLIVLFVAAVFAVSCVQDDDYDTPNLDVQSPDLETEPITLVSMKSLYDQALFDEAVDLGINPNPDPNDQNAVEALENLKASFKFIFDAETILYSEGYVISNDEFGNYFEELIIQNNYENPTLGVKVLINVSPLFVTYEFGRKVYIRLDGLAIGYDSGVLTVGVLNGNSLDKIALSEMINFVIRDIDVKDIVPLPINISDFEVDKTNLYIRLSDMQFHRNDVMGDAPKTYAAEPGDEFDGERTLESCTEGLSVIFSTSTFADFKAVSLPTGRGTLDGLLVLDFFGDTFNVVVNSPATINFDSTDRCDPSEVDCGLASSTGSNELFSEFFESQNEGSPISGNGWTNYSQEGSEVWESFFSDDANASLGISATIGSFNSGDDSTIAWLITPEFDFDAQDGETLNFKTSNSYDDGSTLELLFSGDWDGNPDNIATATWDLVPAAYIVNDDDDFRDWLPSGNVSLDCITGTGYIAFKYQGSGDADFDGSYELDEIEVNAN